MRDPKVEEFLAHTRLASEDDAKADFERRVERRVEEAKYSADEPRDEHGRWGDGGRGVPGTMSPNGQIDHELDRSHSQWTQATSPAASELEKAGFRHALSDQPRAQTGVRAYDRGYDVGLGYKYPVTEGQRKINMQRFGSEKLPKLDTRTPAVALVTAAPHTRIGLRDAPAGETKYSADEARDEHGRWGSGGEAVFDPTKLKFVDGLAQARVPLSRILAQSNHMTSVIEAVKGGRHSLTPDAPVYLKSREDRPGYYEVADGHHRIAEAMARGETSIRADIDEVPDDEPLEAPFYKFKSALAVETKYSDDQPRDDHGRFGLITGRDYEGEDANSSHITRVETGYLPVSAVASLRGAKGEVPGEHRHKQGAAWDSFKTDIDRNGMRDPIFITKDWNKEAVISEGNHRRDAAVELGNINIPVEIRYFGNAQKQGLVR